ncbi:uncharacterized protein PG998_001893 [Apiospora kogelbergensis]|uniref:uncharacterized protein n=1 Tax=Apiospora kogelbergensis TaxID=1337665 RepID=UPI00312DDE65
MSLTYTSTTHSTPYPRIDPRQPHLSATTNTVMIVGGSAGIGRATAAAFLAAGTTRLVLTGRREEVLSAAATELAQQQPGSDAKILTFAVDVTDEAGMEHVFVETERTFGNPPDIVINSAGLLGGPLKPLATLDNAGFKDWWSAFEVNVRGAASLARLVVQHATSAPSVAAPNSKKDRGLTGATPTPTTLIQLSTAGALFPASGALPMSAYAASKLAAIKVMEYIGAETDPGCCAFCRIWSLLSGLATVNIFVKNIVNLPAHFLVWAASREAEFLRNKLVFATWDVDELVARREEIANCPELLIGPNGFPSAI